MDSGMCNPVGMNSEFVSEHSRSGAGNSPYHDFYCRKVGCT